MLTYCYCNKPIGKSVSGQLSVLMKRQNTGFQQAIKQNALFDPNELFTLTMFYCCIAVSVFFFV